MGCCVQGYKPYRKIQLPTKPQISTQAIIAERQSVNIECPICYVQYNLNDNCPYMVCMNQHNLCNACLQKFIRDKKGECPFCKLCVDFAKATKNRILVDILANPPNILDKNTIKIEIQKEQPVENKKSINASARLYLQQRGQISNRQNNTPINRVLVEAKKHNYKQVVQYIQSKNPLHLVYLLQLCYLQIDVAIDLSIFTSLKTLYMYENNLNTIGCIGNLVHLNYLDLSSNKITKLDNLEKLLELTYLGLGSNQISVIQNLGNLKQLATLNLRGNKIKKIENFNGLQKLKTLHLQNNFISKIQNLQICAMLETLDLRDNHIQIIANLQNQKKLTHLYLKGNFIDAANNDRELTKLKEIKVITIL